MAPNNNTCPKLDIGDVQPIFLRFVLDPTNAFFSNAPADENGEKEKDPLKLLTFTLTQRTDSVVAAIGDRELTDFHHAHRTCVYSRMTTLKNRINAGTIKASTFANFAVPLPVTPDADADGSSNSVDKLDSAVIKMADKMADKMAEAGEKTNSRIAKHASDTAKSVDKLAAEAEGEKTNATVGKLAEEGKKTNSRIDKHASDTAKSFDKLAVEGKKTNSRIDKHASDTAKSFDKLAEEGEKTNATVGELAVKVGNNAQNINNLQNDHNVLNGKFDHLESEVSIMKDQINSIILSGFGASSMGAGGVSRNTRSPLRELAVKVGNNAQNINNLQNDHDVLSGKFDHLESEVSIMKDQINSLILGGFGASCVGVGGVSRNTRSPLRDMSNTPGKAAESTDDENESTSDLMQKDTAYAAIFPTASVTSVFTSSLIAASSEARSLFDSPSKATTGYALSTSNDPPTPSTSKSILKTPYAFQTPNEAGAEAEGIPVVEKPFSPMQTYVMSDHDGYSESESDEEYERSRPEKSIPEWAIKSNLHRALERQFADGPHRLDPVKIFGEVITCNVNLEEIFDKKKASYQGRTSSGNWGKDHVTHEASAATSPTASVTSESTVSKIAAGSGSSSLFDSPSKATTGYSNDPLGSVQFCC